MNIRELRIGNYVDVEDVMAEVVGICSDKNLVEVQISTGRIIEFNPAEIKPVQLTGDMLIKKCKFDNYGRHILGIDHDRYYLKLQDNYIILSNRKNEPLIHFWDVKYLHRLQNLYYALKGKEIEVMATE